MKRHPRFAPVCAWGIWLAHGNLNEKRSFALSAFLCLPVIRNSATPIDVRLVRGEFSVRPALLAQDFESRGDISSGHQGSLSIMLCAAKGGC